MAEKVRVLPTSRVGAGPLADMAQQLRSFVPGWESAAPSVELKNPASSLRGDFDHLTHHDADGVLVASHGTGVVGFVASYVRSRHLVVSHLWVLPEYENENVAPTLFRRALQFGERSGTQRVIFHALTPWQLALALRMSLTPVFPLLRLRLTAETAVFLGNNLARTLPSMEVTKEAVSRRAFFADLERLDRLVRGFARPMDHEYWLFSRNLRLAVVREGERITAYACGGPGQCGPVVGATEESALAALGWALQFAGEAAPASAQALVELLVPTPFTRAFDHLLEGNTAVLATSFWLTNDSPRINYFVPGSFTLL